MRTSFEKVSGNAKQRPFSPAPQVPTDSPLNAIYALMFNKHSSPMWVLDAQTLQFISVNEAALSHYGYSRNVFLRMNLADINFPQDNQNLTDYVAQILSRQALVQSGVTDIWKHVKQNGKSTKVEITWNVFDQNNKKHFLCTLRPVGDNQERCTQGVVQEGALSQITEAVFAINNHRRLIYWNKAAEKLYHFKPHEVLGKVLEDVVQYRYLNAEQETHAKNSLSQRGYWSGEKIHFKKEGTPVCVDSSVSILRNGAGSVIGMLSVSKDITERKRVEQELTKANDTLKAMIEAAPVAIVSQDLDGIIRMWNPAAERIFGWRSEEILGKTYKVLVPPEYHSEHDLLSAQIKEGEAFLGQELIRITKKGEKIDVHVAKAPLHDSSGNITGIVSLLNDITDRKKAESALRTAKEAADSANRAKSEFIANISHEIRTPLGAISGFAEMMFDAKQTVPERINCITRIRRNVKNLTALIDDLLDLSKVEAGKFEIIHEEFDLLSELHEVISILQSQALRKGLGLKVFFEGKTPKTVESDPTRVRQILVNVIGNAIKFTERGTVTLKVLMLPNQIDPPFLQFLISDTGLGIDKKEEVTIFEPFAQLDSSATRRFGGTGLGLNLSRRLARMLGGDVELVESSPGSGSTFSVTLQVGDLKNVEWLENVTDAELKSQPTMARSALTQRLDGMRVLLVEDGHDNQFLLSHFLRNSGARVDLAMNGLEGVTMAQKLNYDIILMDIQMPVLDGYAATTRLRQAGTRTPIVALTAHAMKEEKERCYNVGCNHYLSKPVDMGTLLKTVANYRSRTLH